LASSQTRKWALTVPDPGLEVYCLTSRPAPPSEDRGTAEEAPAYDVAQKSTLACSTWVSPSALTACSDPLTPPL
jgi:hypothetical protein